MKNENIRRMAVLSAVIIMILSYVPEALGQGCAMCGTVGPKDTAGAEALNGSILFMMIMPYMLFLSIGGWVFYKHKKRRDTGKQTL